MLSLDFSQLFEINKRQISHSLSQTDLNNFAGQFSTFKLQIESRQQGFIDFSECEEMLQQISDYTTGVEGKFSDIVILGIGGSMLGPKCILESLYFSKPKNQQKINVHCLDNIDPDQIATVASDINLAKTLFLVQTKSGTTPETVAQYLFFKDLLLKKGCNPSEQMVFVTDPEVGLLRKIAIEENVKTFDLASNIGGRFSVLTPIGLLVASLVGLDIEEMMIGAKNTLTRFFEQDNLDIYNLALTQFILNKKGKTQTVIMPYFSQFRTLANWYVQLLSESIGKEFDRDGKLVNVGLTPVPSLGATDQHSQLQLFKEGPNDKLFIFIIPQGFKHSLAIPNLYPSEASLNYLNQTSFNKLLMAEFAGTKASLTESSRPSVTIAIDKANEYSLGELFMSFMLSTAFLGELLNIDTFDQPGVERSKVLAKEILSK